MLVQPFAPPKLVTEFRTGRWVAIWEVNTADNQSTDIRFDVTRVCIVGVARKDPRSFDQLLPFREDCNAIPAFLPVPNSVIPGPVYICCGEAVLRCLELLKANDVRRGFREPLQQRWKSRVDAVDIECGNSHRAKATPQGDVTLGDAQLREGSACTAAADVGNDAQLEHIHGR